MNNIEVLPRWSDLENREVFDVLREGRYITGGFHYRESAQTVADMFTRDERTPGRWLAEELKRRTLPPYGDEWQERHEAFSNEGEIEP